MIACCIEASIVSQRKIVLSLKMSNGFLLHVFLLVCEVIFSWTLTYALVIQKNTVAVTDYLVPIELTCESNSIKR